MLRRKKTTMSTITVETVTVAQLSDLRTAAGQAGDLMQVALCDRALGDYDSATEIREAGLLDSGDRVKLRGIDRARATEMCVDAINDAANR